MMNLSRFLKTTSIPELEQMPAPYIHTIFKEYFEFSKNEDAQKAQAMEDMIEQQS